MRPDGTPARRLWLLLWIAAGIVAIVALFRLLNASPGQLFDRLAATPWWVYAATVALTGANQVIGALKWRRAAGWLTPGAQPVPWTRLVEATTVGSLLGQVLPLQISVPLGRWLTLRGDSAGWVVRSSIYEQIFDLVALLAAGTAGMVALVLAPDLERGLAIAVFVALACLAGLRIGFRFGARVFRWLEVKFGRSFAGPLAEVLDRAAAAPAGTLALLLGWSFARLAAVTLRAVVIAFAFVPGVSPFAVAAAYPAAGLATALPIAPAGLGLAEWSWTGLLVMLGAPLADAAVAALAFRVMNTIALTLLSAGLLGPRLLRRRG